MYFGKEIEKKIEKFPQKNSKEKNVWLMLQCKGHVACCKNDYLTAKNEKVSSVAVAVVVVVVGMVYAKQQITTATTTPQLLDYQQQQLTY